MSRIRDIANILTASTNIATDAEVTAAMSAHNTATNGHIGRGTTQNRPASPSVGDVYFDTTLAALIAYKSTGWEKVSQDPAPGVSSITPTTAATTGTTITITGSDFKTGLSVQFIGTNSSTYNSPSVTFLSGSSITATTPGLPVAFEPYDVKVINSDNQFGILENCLDSGGTPTWNTASGALATISEQTALNVSVSATDPDGTSIVYSSSNLPAWISLNSSTGALTGTSPDIASDTTYSFDISASDGVNTSSRSFSVIVTAIVSFSANYLLVGGGGASGYRSDDIYYLGGGGGGGLRSSLDGNGGGAAAESPLTLTTGITYNISVGLGGVAAAYGQLSSANNGGNSSISGSGITTITALGGGAGSNADTAGQNGGSGGGAGGNDLVRSGGSALSPTQGYAGGSVGASSGGSGAGGGGAGSVGGNRASTLKGGTGGAAKINSITGSNVYYAGGGPGAGGYHPPSLGDFGTGYSRTANRGMGGYMTVPANAVNSGTDGVVIIRSSRTAANVTGTVVVTTVGGDTVYQFNTDGTVTF
jgi:hypothetical protein